MHVQFIKVYYFINIYRYIYVWLILNLFIFIKNENLNLKMFELVSNDLNDDDYYLSDIHCENTSFMNTKDSSENTNDLKISRIEFNVPLNGNSEWQRIISMHDADGDLVLERKTKKYLFKIEHCMKTKLKDVGLQLWRASFYLMDFIIANASLFQNKRVVELGAGLGVASMTASLYASQVYCTDIPRVVAQAEKNFILNREFLSDNICFKSLVWNQTYQEYDDDSDENLINSDSFHVIKNADVFIAADVIYDDIITLKFMNTLYKLLTEGNRNKIKCCFIAGEKRVNFNTHSLNATDCAYNYFKESLLELHDYIDSEKGVKFKVTQLDCTEMPQFVINYERNAYLYIWKLEMFPA